MGIYPGVLHIKNNNTSKIKIYVTIWSYELGFEIHVLSIVCTVHILVFTRQNNSFRVWGSHVFLRPGVIPTHTHPPHKQCVRPYLERNIVTYEASTNIDNPPQRAPTPTAIGRLLNVAPYHYPGQCWDIAAIFRVVTLKAHMQGNWLGLTLNFASEHETLRVTWALRYGGMRHNTQRARRRRRRSGHGNETMDIYKMFAVLPK